MAKSTGDMARQAKRERAKCRLCGRLFDSNHTFGVPGQMAPGEDVSDRTGDTVEIELCGLPMVGLVATPGAPLRAEGFDVLLVACSLDCQKIIYVAAEVDGMIQGRETTDLTPSGVFGLRRARSPEAMDDPRLERLDLFEAMLRTVAPHLAKRLGIEEPFPLPGPDAGPEEQQAAAERLLDRSCAWCLRRIPRNRPAESLHFWLKGWEVLAHDRGFMAMQIGRRRVWARLAEPESPASAFGDAEFLLCSNSCVAALRAAIDEDQRLSVVH